MVVCKAHYTAKINPFTLSFWSKSMIWCWNCQRGISLVFLISNDDEYEMQSIDELYYMFPASLSHDKWHKFNVEHDAAKGFQWFVSYKFVVHREPEATYTFGSQNNEKSIFQPLSGIPGNPWDLSWVSWPQNKPCWFANRIWQSGQARRLSVAVSEYETPARGFIAMPQHWLAYEQNSGALENPQLESHCYTHSTAHLPIPFGTETL